MNSNFPLANITHSSHIDVGKCVNLLQMNLSVYKLLVSGSKAGAYLRGGHCAMHPLPFWPCVLVKRTKLMMLK